MWLAAVEWTEEIHDTVNIFRILYMVILFINIPYREDQLKLIKYFTLKSCVWIIFVVDLDIIFTAVLNGISNQNTG